MDSKEQETRGDGLVNPGKGSRPVFEGKGPQIDFSKPLDPEVIQDALFPYRHAERDLQEVMRKEQERRAQNRPWLIRPRFIGLVVAGGLMALGYSANGGSLSTAWGLISLVVGLGVFAWMNRLEAGS